MRPVDQGGFPLIITLPTAVAAGCRVRGANCPANGGLCMRKYSPLFQIHSRNAPLDAPPTLRRASKDTRLLLLPGAAITR